MGDDASEEVGSLAGQAKRYGATRGLAHHPRGRQLQMLDQRGEIGGIAQPLGFTPVGAVDLLLHACAVKPAVGEAVHRNRLQPLDIEKLAKVGPGPGVFQIVKRAG
jgi:hypothetical protein